MIKAAKGDHHDFESYIHTEIILLLLTFNGIWIALTLSDITNIKFIFLVLKFMTDVQKWVHHDNSVLEIVYSPGERA